MALQYLEYHLNPAIVMRKGKLTEKQRNMAHLQSNKDTVNSGIIFIQVYVVVV